MTSPLFQRARIEILEFHRFFVAWYDAATSGETDFGRCEQVFGDGFHMIGPGGRMVDRAGALDLIASNRATYNGDFSIEIEDIAAVWEDDGAIAVTYVERQSRSGVRTSRRASALFTESSSAPHGVQWRHLHETWMPMEET